MTRAVGKRKGRAATSLKSIEEHAAVYAAVVASALDAVIVVDEEGVVVAINRPPKRPSAPAAGKRWASRSGR
jgi:PAS domain-containing protein